MIDSAGTRSIALDAKYDEISSQLETESSTDCSESRKRRKSSSVGS
jgi:hypothetical protein